MSRSAGRWRRQAEGLSRLGLLQEFRWPLLGGLGLLVIASGSQLAYPLVFSWFIDHIVVEQDLAWLGAALLIGALVLVLQAAAASGQYYLFASTGSKIVARLRHRLYAAMLRREIAFFDRQNVGDLTNRLAADVEKIQSTLTVETALFMQTLLMALGSISMLLVLSPTLAGVALLIAPAMVVSARWIGGLIKTHSMARQDRLAACAQHAQETLSNVRVVHAFAQEANETARYGRATQDALDHSLACNRMFAGVQGVNAMVQGGALLVTLWWGGRLVAAGTISVGDLAGFVLYANMAAGAVGTLSTLWGEWMQSVGATERAFELLQHAPEPGRGAGGEREARSRQAAASGCIEFEAVSFAYPTRAGHRALEGISLTVAPGEKLALIGPSGSGKTTLVNLLLGFYPPSEGRLCVGDMDVREMDRLALRAHIAVVEQEPVLFTGTIRENMVYGCDAAAAIDEARFMAAAVDASVHSFVAELPGGYETEVGHRGLQLSGGQKQRVAIARALLRDPSILILDEATSALDSQSEGLVQAALARLMVGRTTVIIAHRLSTVAHVDRLVVMNKGRIEQVGTHQQLSAQASGLYAQLLRRQRLAAEVTLETEMPPTRCA
ncbi:MAG: ABC transporter ATP-binding protein [Pseudomonadota bacterium]